MCVVAHGKAAYLTGLRKDDTYRKCNGCALAGSGVGHGLKKSKGSDWLIDELGDVCRHRAERDKADSGQDPGSPGIIKY